MTAERSGLDRPSESDWQLKLFEPPMSPKGQIGFSAMRPYARIKIGGHLAAAGRVPNMNGVPEVKTILVRHHRAVSFRSSATSRSVIFDPSLPKRPVT